MIYDYLPFISATQNANQRQVIKTFKDKLGLFPLKIMHPFCIYIFNVISDGDNASTLAVMQYCDIQ